VLRRWGLRIGLSLVGILAGLLICAAVLSDFSISASALVAATLLFWVVHLAVQFMALKVLVRQPSIPLAGLLALASTVVALLIVSVVVEGLKIHSASTYVFATVIIWVTTAIADTVARRMIREDRLDHREERRDGRRA
jgi:FlaA1/EpsC-like NDP-sugar epimerase